MFSLLGNLFLWAFLLDSIFTIIATQMPDPMFSRCSSQFAFGTLILGFTTFLAWLFSRRIPVRVFLGPWLGLIWAALGSFPIMILSSSLRNWRIATSSINLIIGLFSFWLLRQANLREKRKALPLLAAGNPNAAGWIGRFFGLSFASMAVAIVGLAVYLIWGIQGSMAHFTSDFLKISATGIESELRVFKKDKTLVYLFGMAHIADDEFYEYVLREIPREGHIILMEGVSDKNDLLAGSHLPYDQIAEKVGLATQGVIQTKMAEEYHSITADLDCSDFKPSTLKFLADITKKSETGLSYTVSDEVYKDSSHLIVIENLIEDLIQSRNQHLLSQLEKYQSTYRHIVVPWGAIHMRGIVAGIEELGYQETKRQALKVVRWNASDLNGNTILKKVKALL